MHQSIIWDKHNTSTTKVARTRAPPPHLSLTTARDYCQAKYTTHGSGEALLTDRLGKDLVTICSSRLHRWLLQQATFEPSKRWSGGRRGGLHHCLVRHESNLDDAC